MANAVLPAAGGGGARQAGSEVVGKAQILARLSRPYGMIFVAI